MDYVKREDQNVIDEDSYKAYLDSLQKSQMETSEYQHTPISMEQLHQAMQSTFNTGSIVHNFQLPLSPRQMSTLMLKSNLQRPFNDLSHLPRNLTTELDLAHNLAAELPQSLRHEDILTRTLVNELELQNGLTQTLVQNITEQELRINEVMARTAELAHGLGNELDLSQHLPRQVEDHILGHEEERRTPMIVQCVPSHVLDQGMPHRLEQRLDQRLPPLIQERQLDNEHLMPMQFHIKSEQEDEGYFYENINQNINNINGINGHIQQEHGQSQQANVHTDGHVYSIYQHHQNIPALNPIEHIYARQNYNQNFQLRENPQNLVVHRQYDNSSPYQQEEFKKIRQDGAENGGKSDKKEPKENLKPDDNKIVYDAQLANSEKHDNIEKPANKVDELSMNIKGEYACYKCNEVYPSKRGLKHHAKLCIEEGEETTEKVGKFVCSQCAYRCQSPAILKIHERTHSGEKPFSCTFCDYKSGQKNNVVKHILVHMKEKPFRCQYCDYRCSQKNNLVVHERTHTGYKPFACPYCEYRTVQKPNLVKHMYLHTDQKPFSCDVCSYRCVQKTNLTKHKQRHLNEKDGEKAEIKNQVKPYRPRQKSVKCPHCAYRCVQKSSMEKHLQYKHNITELQDGLSLNLMKNQEESNSVSDMPQSLEGLNLMKNSGLSEELIQNLSVKKPVLFVSAYKDSVPYESIE